MARGCRRGRHQSPVTRRRCFAGLRSGESSASAGSRALSESGWFWQFQSHSNEASVRRVGVCCRHPRGFVRQQPCAPAGADSRWRLRRGRGRAAAHGCRRRGCAGRPPRLPHLSAASLPARRPACSRRRLWGIPSATWSGTRTTRSSIRRPSPMSTSRRARFASPNSSRCATTSSSSASAPRSTTLGPRAAEHAFPMYTLPHAVRLKTHLLERWNAADHDPSLIDDGALNVVVVGGGPLGSKNGGSGRRAVSRRACQGLPRHPAAGGARNPRRGWGRAVLDVQAQASRVRNQGAIGTDGRAADRTRRRLRVCDPRDAQVRRRAQCPHPRVGAGLQGNQLVQSLGLELERGNRIGVGGDLALPDHPELDAVGDVAAILDTKSEQVLPQLGSVALQSGEHVGETISRRIAGKKTKPFAYHDKGTMAAIGRGAAGVQMLGGRTITGRKAQVAWLTVHLALLPTNEDRARAVVDWPAPQRPISGPGASPSAALDVAPFVQPPHRVRGFTKATSPSRRSARSSESRLASARAGWRAAALVRRCGPGERTSEYQIAEGGTFCLAAGACCCHANGAARRCTASEVSSRIGSRGAASHKRPLAERIGYWQCAARAGGSCVEPRAARGYGLGAKNRARAPVSNGSGSIATSPENG